MVLHNRRGFCADVVLTTAAYRVSDFVAPAGDALWGRAGDAFDFAAGFPVGFGEADVVREPTFRKQIAVGEPVLDRVDNVLEADGAVGLGVVVDDLEDQVVDGLVLTSIHCPAVEPAGSGGVEDLDASGSLSRFGVACPCLFGYGSTMRVRQWGCLGHTVSIIRPTG